MKNIPAFPNHDHLNKSGMMGNFVEITQKQMGMTLRDYFAAKAMQGIMASGHSVAEDFNPDWEGYDGGIPEEFESVAQEAYLMADAMLKARGEQ